MYSFCPLWLAIVKSGHVFALFSLNSEMAMLTFVTCVGDNGAKLGRCGNVGKGRCYL